MSISTTREMRFQEDLFNFGIDFSRFAAARWHQYEGIAPRQCLLDHLKLTRPKGVVPEVLFEYRFDMLQSLMGSFLIDWVLLVLIIPHNGYLLEHFSG